MEGTTRQQLMQTISAVTSVTTLYLWSTTSAPPNPTVETRKLTALCAVFSLLGCIYNVPGLTEVYILELNLDQCNTKVRIGYYGMCTFQDGV